MRQITPLPTAIKKYSQHLAISLHVINWQELLLPHVTDDTRCPGSTQCHLLLLDLSLYMIVVCSPTGGTEQSETGGPHTATSGPADHKVCFPRQACSVKIHVFKTLYQMPFIPYVVCLIFWCPWNKTASIQGPRRTLKLSDVCHAESERDSTKTMTEKNLPHSPRAWGVSWPSADTGKNVLTSPGL